jgi:hypothetical protein
MIVVFTQSVGTSWDKHNDMQSLWWVRVTGIVKPLNLTSSYLRVKKDFL